MRGKNALKPQIFQDQWHFFVLHSSKIQRGWRTHWVKHIYRMKSVLNYVLQQNQAAGKRPAALMGCHIMVELYCPPVAINMHINSPHMNWAIVTWRVLASFGLAGWTITPMEVWKSAERSPGRHKDRRENRLNKSKQPSLALFDCHVIYSL